MNETGSEFGAIDRDGFEVGIDEPDQADADIQVFLNLLGDDFVDIGGREEFDRQDWYAID